MAEMTQDIGIVAAGLLEGVGEDGEALEVPAVVDGVGEPADGAAVPRQEWGRQACGAEGVAGDVAEEVRLAGHFGGAGGLPGGLVGAAGLGEGQAGGGEGGAAGGDAGG